MTAFYSDSSSFMNQGLDECIDKVKSSENIDEYELSLCCTWIKTNNFKKVCLQFPDSLLSKSVDIAFSLEKQLGFKVYILGDSTYASCCVDEITAAHINADAIVHFGHTCLSPVIRLPVYYILPHLSLNINLFAERLIKFSEESSSVILLVYDVGYHHLKDSMQASLKSIESKIIMSDLIVSSSCQLPSSQSERNSAENSTVKLGRSFKLPEDVETYSIVYTSGENLSNLEGFAVSNLNAPVYRYTEEEGINLVNVNSLIKRKLYLIEKIKDASTIGILVATLGVKDYLQAIDRVKVLCKQSRKKSYIISVGRPTVAKLANFPEIEVFVMVSCPETRLENHKDFMQPMVSLMDVEIALNKTRRWEGKTSMDFRDLLPGGAEYVPVENNDIFEDITDVSLLTNKLRCSQIVDENENSSNSDVAVRQNMSCVVSETFSLKNRSWQGLQQNLGLTPVAFVEEGRKGTPSSGYTSSKSEVKS